MKELTLDKKQGHAWQTDLTPTDNLYSTGYWDRYQEYRDTAIEKRLNQARVQLVSKYTNQITDIGIGNGSFIESCQANKISANGTDINPKAISWLKARSLYTDPTNLQNASLWDTLEHFIDPATILDQIKGYCFVSLPIIGRLENITSWKHYRPGEHLHYWTEAGLYWTLGNNGFVCCEVTDQESHIGRQDILTFVFKRTE